MRINIIRCAVEGGGDPGTPGSHLIKGLFTVFGFVYGMREYAKKKICCTNALQVNDKQANTK